MGLALALTCGMSKQVQPFVMVLQSDPPIEFTLVRRRRTSNKNGLSSPHDWQTRHSLAGYG